MADGYEGAAVPMVPLTDQISLGVLTVSVPRDDVNSAIALHGKGALRKGGTLPPHVMMYYAVAMALFSDENYEGVMRRLTSPLRLWGSWDHSWRRPTAGGIVQARQRLGFEPVKTLFESIAVPVTTAATLGARCAGRRLVSFDGMVFDLPASEENVAEFGIPSGGAFPQARVVTLAECGSHVELGAVIGGVTGKGSGERTAAAELIGLLQPGWMCLCDSGFYSFDLWCKAAATGCDLLWRVGDTMQLPVVKRLGDGSYTTLLYAPGVRGNARAGLLERARRGDDLADAADTARLVRVIEYTVADRGSGELICLLSTILDPRDAPAAMLAAAYHQRWEHEHANRQIKQELRGPARILRSRTPDMVRQEIYGYLIAHYATCALICGAATDTGIDPDRLKYADTLRIVRDRIADPDAFSP